MKRAVVLWAIIALVAAGAWTPAAAQATGDTWEITVAPYLMGASMNGTTTVRGRDFDVDLSMSDIFSNLQFGAMGLVVAKKGNWGFGADAIWMALGTTLRNTNVDFNQGAFAFYGLRQLGPAADVLFGLRVNTLQGTLNFKALGVDVSQDETWVDPLVGLRLRTPPDRPVHLQVYSEIGGFGAGSDFTWQIFPTVGFKIAPKASLEVGYRWLDLDYSKGEGTEKFPLHELRARLAELPRDREIHVICRSAQRAYSATRILLQHGFKARNISGGMLFARDAGVCVDREAGPRSRVTTGRWRVTHRVSRMHGIAHTAVIVRME